MWLQVWLQMWLLMWLQMWLQMRGGEEEGAPADGGNLND